MCCRPRWELEKGLKGVRSEGLWIPPEEARGLGHAYWFFIGGCGFMFASRFPRICQSKGQQMPRCVAPPSGAETFQIPPGTGQCWMQPTAPRRSHWTSLLPEVKLKVLVNVLICVWTYSRGSHWFSMTSNSRSSSKGHRETHDKAHPSGVPRAQTAALAA